MDDAAEYVRSSAASALTAMMRGGARFFRRRARSGAAEWEVRHISELSA